MTRARRASSSLLEGLRKSNASTMLLSDCLGLVLMAAREGSLTCGVGPVAQALESDVDAALCVLASNGRDLTDPAVQIYFKLIEAYCIEYGIHLLKVDTGIDLRKWVSQSNATEATCNCVLIKESKYSRGLAILRNYCLQEGGSVSKDAAGAEIEIQMEFTL